MSIETKRKLTTAEIESCIDFIQPFKGIPKESAESIRANHKADLREQLIKIELYPSLLGELKERLRRDYFSSLIPAGESVGVIAGQSIGEKNTQTTLNSFHVAGLGSLTITQGIPRMDELLLVPKKPRVVNSTVYFKANNHSITTLREDCAHEIVCVKLKQLTDCMFVSMDKPDEPWYELFETIYTSTFRAFPHCVTAKLNIEMLHRYRLTLPLVAKAIEDNYGDVVCVFSPLLEAQIDIFAKTDSVSFGNEKIAYITADNYLEIYMEERVLAILEDLPICGVEGVNAIFYNIKQTGDNKEWRCETEGTNYMKLLGHPKVDFTRTISNNVWDTHSCLGIEAARIAHIQEMITLMGEGINLCHIEVLVDKMTHSGTFRPISRFSLKKDSVGVMSKASFEESVEIYLESAFACEVEKTKGVAASVICGKRANLGTGFLDLKVDTKLLKDHFSQKRNLVKDIVIEE